MVELVTAKTFHRFTDNGRTSPGIFSCEGSAGENEYVVKLKGGMEFGNGALLCELFASILAAHFGISCPTPAIVLIEADLIELAATHPSASERQRRVLHDSIGLNFGSQFLTNLTQWPKDKSIPAEIEPAATKVFAFDALIQNPDRTFQNPNLGIRGDELFIYDHESAFSFLLAMFPSRTPWILAFEPYLEKHVFARLLRGSPLPDDFVQSLAELSDQMIDQIAACIPIEWRSAHLETIKSHLKVMQQHASEFTVEVTRRLA